MSTASNSCMTGTSACVYVHVYNSFLTLLNSYAQHFEASLPYSETRFSVVVVGRRLRGGSWRVRRVDRSSYNKWYTVLIDRFPVSQQVLNQGRFISMMSFTVFLLLFVIVVSVEERDRVSCRVWCWYWGHLALLNTAVSRYFWSVILQHQQVRSQHHVQVVLALAVRRALV